MECLDGFERHFFASSDLAEVLSVLSVACPSSYSYSSVVVRRWANLRQVRCPNVRERPNYFLRRVRFSPSTRALGKSSWMGMQFFIERQRNGTTLEHGMAARWPVRANRQPVVM